MSNIEEKETFQNRMTFGEWLKLKRIERMSELMRSTGKPVVINQNDQAEWIGVPNTSYNQWENDLRLPRGVNVDLLAEKLGPEVYERLGVPERIPTDPLLRRWIRLYYDADEETRNAMLRDLERASEGKTIPNGVMVFATQQS